MNYPVRAPLAMPQQPMNPLLATVLSQLGTNPQSLIEQIMPYIAPHITPVLDEMIKSRLDQHLSTPKLETAQVKSGADALIEFTDKLISIELQNKIMADPSKLAALVNLHGSEISGMSARLSALWDGC